MNHRVVNSVWFLLLMLLFCVPARLRGQVFTVGERTATEAIKTDFVRTHVELPGQALTERGRRDLVRNLEAEQGFARHVLPLASIVDLQANGSVRPAPEAYKMMVYKKGQAAAPGDRVEITALQFKRDRILLDFNGGPYVKHRFLRHLQIGVGGVETPEPDLTETATGWRVELIFEGGVPEVSAPEVKALLEPLVDFGVKTGELAYAETLPVPVKNAIASHEVLVGMNHRMVLAALGQPESKVRESNADGRYEEWIYGQQPHTIKFIRFVGDRVTLLKIAAAGKPIEIHQRDEMAGFTDPGAIPVLTVANGPGLPAKDGVEGKPPPSLKLPNEASTPAESETGVSERKVLFPDAHPASNPIPSTPTPPRLQWTETAAQ